MKNISDIELELRRLLHKKYEIEDEIEYFSNSIQEVQDKLKSARARIKEVDAEISTTLQEYIIARAKPHISPLSERQKQNIEQDWKSLETKWNNLNLSEEENDN